MGLSAPARACLAAVLEYIQKLIHTPDSCACYALDYSHATTVYAGADLVPSPRRVVYRLGLGLGGD